MDIGELMRRRHSGGKKSILPSGYIQLEYIVGNSAWINTGLRATNPHKYECELMWFSLGVRQITGANGGNFFGINSAGEWQNGNAANGSIGVQANAGQWYHIIQDRPGSVQKLNIDGTTYTTTVTYVENDIFIFATTTNGDTTALKYGALKYMKIWIGDELVRHFIPCINPSDVVGMYDIVNNVFYSSVTSSDFGASYGDCNVGIVNNVYINQAGAFAAYTDFFYTTPLYVRSGQTIEFSGYVGAVTSGISSLESTGPVMLVQGSGSSTYKTYTYIADRDMMIMFSAKRGDTPPVITVDGNNITIHKY